MRTRAQQRDFDAIEAVKEAKSAAKPKAKTRDRGTGRRASIEVKPAATKAAEAVDKAPEEAAEAIEPLTLQSRTERSRTEDVQQWEAQRPDKDVSDPTIDETVEEGLGQEAISDDDDAPEEVSLSACKKAVEDQQQLESEQKRLVKEQRRKRLREREQLNEGALSNAFHENAFRQRQCSARSGVLTSFRTLSNTSELEA